MSAVNRMTGRRPRSAAAPESWMLGRTRRVHFVGIGGIGMSGIAELLANLGYEVTRFGRQGIGCDAAARTTRRAGAARARRRTRRRRRGGRGVFGDRRGEPGDRRGAPPPHSRDSARRDARRADAAALRHRHRRRARQDDDDVDGGAGAGARRPRSDRRDRRTVERVRQQRPARTRRSRWSSRRTRATGRSSSCRRRSPWSRTSTASTWRPTAAGRRCNDAFVEFINKVPFYGAAILCTDDDAVRGAGAARHPARDHLWPCRRIAPPTSPDATCSSSRSARAARSSRASTGQRGRARRRCGCRCPAGTTCSTRWAPWPSASSSRCRSARIAAALGEFSGAERRFQVRGERRGVMVVDDYGHHPDRDRRGDRRGARDRAGG